MMRRIALIVGDTPGHFYPALSVADAYARAEPATETLLLGPPGGVAARLAHTHGCRYEPIAGAPWVGAGVRGKLVAAAQTVRAIATARRALRTHGTRVVIGFGGYVSGAVILAARSLGLRTVIHEANVWPGVANRWLGRAVHRVYLNFAAAGRHFPSDRQLVVGWPVRRDIIALAREPRVPPSPARPARILVMEGASRATDFLCRRGAAVLARVASRGLPIEVRHQHAVGDGERVAAEYARAGIRANVAAYLDSVADAYRWADFAIVRAGAGVLAELAVAGLPALLVPVADAAEDHQLLNARTFAESGGAIWICEDAWDSDALGAKLYALLRDPEAWALASAGARRFAKADAADRVVADCENTMRGRW